VPPFYSFLPLGGLFTTPCPSLTVRLALCRLPPLILLHCALSFAFVLNCPLRLPPFLPSVVLVLFKEFLLAPRARVLVPAHRYRAVMSLLSACAPLCSCRQLLLCVYVAPLHAVAFTCAARLWLRSLFSAVCLHVDLFVRIGFLYCLYAFLCAHASFCVLTSLSCRRLALRVAYLCASPVYSYVDCSVLITVTRLLVHLVRTF
jgi:hypothetical protein